MADPDKASWGRRVDIALTMDERGRFFIAGEPVTHRRTAQALARGLFADEAGAICTRIGHEWTPVAVADTPLLVTGLVFDPDDPVPTVALSDDSAERLDPEGLWLEGDKLYGRVRQGSLSARFVPAAATDLLVRVLEGDEHAPVARFGSRLVDLRHSKRFSSGGS